MFMVGLRGKKARIVICGNFQEAHPDEFSIGQKDQNSKLPSIEEWRCPWLPTWVGQLSVGMFLLRSCVHVCLETGTQTLGGNEIFMKPPKILVETKVVDDGVVWKIKKALYGLRTSPIAWETERDNTLKSLVWVHDETEYRMLPCQGSPCLWTVVPIRPGEDPSVKTSKEELTRGVVITYVDDLLLTGWQHHIDAITKALLAKYVMKKSGVLPEGRSETGKKSSEGIDFLGASITRDNDGTVWCDQSKYILHCMRENNFINDEGQVVLKKATAPPAVDEKLGEEEGTIREKNDALILCRHLGVTYGKTTRGSQEPFSLLVEILVDDQRPCHVHTTLPQCCSEIQKDECAEAYLSGAQDGPPPCPSPLTVQTYCDASFAPGGGRSRSGILVLLVDQTDQ